VLVGHSYSGMIVTQASVDPKVSALVYIAARAPDAGEDYTALAKRFPTPPASAGLIKTADGYSQLSQEAFLRDFAQDVARQVAHLLPNAVLLTHDGYGHTSPTDPSACVNQALARYFVSLQPPADGTVCPSDHPPFDPNFGQ
jgi:hypothetical protein